MGAIPFAVAAILVVGLITYIRFPAVMSHDLIDTDSYMRMVRIEQLLDTGRWFDERIERSNAPFGEELHWTRPLDVLVLIIWLPLSVLGLQDALFWAGAAVGPVLLIATGLALGWAALPLVGASDRPLAMLGTLGLPALLNYSLPGRVDHHVLLVMILVLAVGCLIRILTSNSKVREPVLMGAWLGIGLWVSVEFLLHIAALLGLLVVAAIVSPRRFATSTLLVSGALLVTASAATFVERGPAFLTARYDSISAAHLGSLAVVALAIWMFRGLSDRFTGGRNSRRVFLGLILFGGAIVAINRWFPPILMNPEQAYDPLVQSMIFDRVSEMQPLWPRTGSDVPDLISQLGPALLGIPIAYFLAFRNRRLPLGRAWTALFALSLFYVLLSLRAFRFAPYAQVISLPILLGGLAQFLGSIRIHESAVLSRVLKASSFIVLLFGLTFIGALVRTERAGATSGACNVESLALSLGDGAAAGTTPKTILGFLDFGPEILYRTPHSVVAAPYGHAPGILDTQSVLAGRDREVAEALLVTRKVDLIALCPAIDQVLFGSDGNTIYNSLIAGRPVRGIERLRVPDPGGFLLFEVRRDRLANSD